MIYIIDFEDSFTYNIASQLSEMELTSEVIHWKKINQFKNKFADKTILIYGPGPGVPEDYNLVFDKITSFFNQKNVFHLGVCLGHQILWHLKGIKVKKAKKVVHGQSVLLNYKGQKQAVQVYHSWVLNLNEQETKNYPGFEFEFYDHECMITKGLNWLTYQFHPESVGTSCPELWFEPLLKFLYNK